MPILCYRTLTIIRSVGQKVKSNVKIFIKTVDNVVILIV